jgi:hypothetical protein
MTTATEQKPATHTFQDDDRVTVLHGWGKVHPEAKNRIDKTLFIGGVARDVRYETAKHWINRTRPDGKNDQVVGAVHVHVLPEDATEPDFIKATGIQPVAMDQFIMQLAGADLDALINEIGIEKARRLIDSLEKHIDAKESTARPR